MNGPGESGGLGRGGGRVPEQAYRLCIFGSGQISAEFHAFRAVQEQNKAQLQLLEEKVDAGGKYLKRRVDDLESQLDEMRRSKAAAPQQFYHQQPLPVMLSPAAYPMPPHAHYLG